MPGRGQGGRTLHVRGRGRQGRGGSQAEEGYRQIQIISDITNNNNSEAAGSRAEIGVTSSGRVRESIRGRFNFLDRDQIVQALDADNIDIANYDSDLEDSDIEELNFGIENWEQENSDTDIDANENSNILEAGSGVEIGYGQFEVEDEIVDENNPDQNGNVAQERRHRPRLKDRLVHDIESAQNVENYDPYKVPEVLVESTAIIQKKTADQDEVKIVWRNQPPEGRPRGRRPANQIVQENAGKVVGPARYCKDELDCFLLFFDNEVFEEIISETNRKITQYNQSFPDVGIRDKERVL